MECSDTRRVDEEKARLALERMDDKSVALMRKLMERAALRHPRHPRTELKIVTVPED